MTFLNLLMMLGLAAIAVPILIHLLSRRNPMIIDWGAMRFLRASHQTRRRRIILEDILLLCLRCLVLALVALAMARPFIFSQSAISWMLVLPLALAAIVGLVMALLTKTAKRRRWIILAIVLIVTAMLVALLEYLIQARRWFGFSDSEDIILMIDGSASMTAIRDRRSNFDLALEEARSVITNADPAATIGIILAGPAPRVLLRPSSDRRAALELLDPKNFRPSAGAMGALEALNAAGNVLAESQNPAKKIFLITDAQSLGWDVKNEARWRFLADRFKLLPTKAKIMCRRLPFPSEYDNAAVTEIAQSRKIIGTDRPVTFDVKISNTGTKPLPATAVELWDDVRLIEEKYLGKEMPPGASESVRFEYRFDRPGWHVLKARLPGNDAILPDNVFERAVEVLTTLPVLLVDGAPSERFFRGASAYTYIALGMTAGPDALSAGPTNQPPARLVMPSVISATDLLSGQDLSPYRAIILLNVPRLPVPVIQRLGIFAGRGGGLLFVPGRRTEAENYNSWPAPDGKPLLPAALQERCELPDNPAHFDLRSFTHPALKLVAESARSDAASVLVKAYWLLAPDLKDNMQVRVCGSMDNNAPLLVERRVGKGCLLISAIAFNNQESNLASRKCFLPFIHELVYYLAEPVAQELNIRPGANLTIEIPMVKAPPKGSKLEVLTPSQQRRPAVMERADNNTMRVSFTETQEPGLYRLYLPQPIGVTNITGPTERPFTVIRQPEESTYQALSDSDFATMKRQIDLAVADRKEDLLAAMKGTAPGSELWKWLAVGALLALLAETLATRWIAKQRRAG
jgi:hypothetical protein